MRCLPCTELPARACLNRSQPPQPRSGNLVETLDQLGDREGARKLMTEAVAELKQVRLEGG